MGRKNLLNLNPSPLATSNTSLEGLRMPQSVGAVKASLKDLTMRSMQDIDPNLIDDAGLRDRLPFDDADVEDLRISIETYGQQVPILLRQNPAEPGRYQIVFGRRRLRALKLIGKPVKAIIRAMEDQELVLAQGQENSVRKDPSFIEKAVFALEMEAADYSSVIIQDALNIDRAFLSHMRTILREIPVSLIQKIGAAPSVGWRRWQRCAEEIKARKLTEAQLDVIEVDPALTSDDRFKRFEAFLTQDIRDGVTPPAPRLSVMAAGEAIGQITRSKTGLVLQVDAKRAPEFNRWLEARGEDVLLDLYRSWQTARSGEDSDDQPCNT